MKIKLGTLLCTLLITAPAFAQWGGLLNKDSGGGLDLGSSLQSQNELVAQYVVAASNVNKAQIMIAESLGRKEEAEKLKAAAAALTASATKDSISEYQEASRAAMQAADEALEDGSALSDESKAQLSAALIPYSRGLLETYKMVPTAVEFGKTAKDQISNASALDKISVASKVGSGVYLATQLPGYVSALYAATNKLITYNKAHKIEVPDDATKALEDIEL